MELAWICEEGIRQGIKMHQAHPQTELQRNQKNSTKLQNGPKMQASLPSKLFIGESVISLDSMYIDYLATNSLVNNWLIGSLSVGSWARAV